jgi:hypothetical protein
MSRSRYRSIFRWTPRPGCQGCLARSSLSQYFYFVVPEPAALVRLVHQYGPLTEAVHVCLVVRKKIRNNKIASALKRLENSCVRLKPLLSHVVKDEIGKSEVIAHLGFQRPGQIMLDERSSGTDSQGLHVAHGAIDGDLLHTAGSEQIYAGDLCHRKALRGNGDQESQPAPCVQNSERGAGSVERSQHPRKGLLSELPYIS